jgi:hypothetical protein
MIDISQCPKCYHDGQVVDSRPWKEFIRRNRRCLKCRHTWRSVEVSLEVFDPLMLPREHIAALEVSIETLSYAIGALRSAFDQIKNEGKADATQKNGTANILR